MRTRQIYNLQAFLIIFSFFLLCCFKRPFRDLLLPCFSWKHKGMWILSLIREEDFVRFFLCSALCQSSYFTCLGSIWKVFFPSLIISWWSIKSSFMRVDGVTCDTSTTLLESLFWPVGESMCHLLLKIHRDVLYLSGMNSENWQWQRFYT